MKYMTSQIMALLPPPGPARRNAWAIGRYVLILLGVIALYSVLFHLIMYYIEGEAHSWLTGFYWTLTVMSTLGFGDITFHSDLGRLFSILVLLTGIVMLLVLLPFVLIRFFFAPYLESRIRLQAPRRVPDETRGHVILCGHDSVTTAIMTRLRLQNIPYYLLEPEPARAGQLHQEGVPVLAGMVEDRTSYEALRTDRARMIVANCGDTVNTNITLTVREVAPAVPIVAVVENAPSVDLLQLSGCTHVIPLKQRLGEHLATRVNAGHLHSHVVGRLDELLIAEFPVHNTPLTGVTVQDSRLGENFGLNVVAVWERGSLRPATPETRLTDSSVPVVMGSSEKMQELDEYLVIYNTNFNPVLVIGGGRVGSAAARTLRSWGVKVHMVERNKVMRSQLSGAADRLFFGDAADRDLIMSAGLAEAPTVLLTTHDDAMNIYLAVYCRRLNPGLRIVSRITHERNIESIHRAGADFALSYASLGAETVLSLIQSRQSVILGEGFELFQQPVPKSLEGKTLAQSTIRARTGLNVLAVRSSGSPMAPVTAATELTPGSEMVMLGNDAQFRKFAKTFR